MANYTLNQELNGIEIAFEAKPTAATLDCLKNAGFRWHRVKKVWYAKQTADRIALAESIADGQPTPAKAEKPETINLDNLGANTPSLYGAELAAAIRADLKKRGVKGVTVRAKKCTHETGIKVTIKATAADIVSVEEYKERYSFSEFSCDAECYHGVFDGSRWIYSATWAEMTEEERRAAYDSHVRYYLAKSPDFNNYHHERKDMRTITTAFYNKVVAVFQIANQWNYNNSDSMTDYFDIGYFLDIDIKTPENLTPREEMTEEERTAYEAEKKAEEEKRASQLAAWKAEEERRAEERAKREAWEKETTAKIYNNVSVEDLDEQIYITNLSGGIGKEATIDELTESAGAPVHEALISRLIRFTDESIYNDFCNMFLYDFDFVAGFGGTASEDVRLKDYDQYIKMNEEQRESVKMYNTNCIAVYLNNDIKLVINPEGYSYARYVYIYTNTSRIYKAAAKLEEMKAESETKPEFYFPAPVAEQVENIHEGQQITIYQCDGWMLNSIYAGFGTVLSVEPGTYAQYNGINIIFTSGKGVFIRDGKQCLIYKGIKNPLPDSVTRKKINDSTSMLYNHNELFPRVLDYYAEQGQTPILDTYQR